MSYPPSDDVPVRLVTTAPAATTSIEQLIWPDPVGSWQERPGVEQMWRLGRWLRDVHELPVDATDTDAPTHLDAVQRLLEDRLAGSTGDPIDRLHWTSLQQWARRLSTTRRVAHGRLGLDGVLVPDASADSGALAVVAPAGLASADPAVDVGGVVGDLVEFTHRSRGAGRDAAPYQRLLTAFLTGYRGITGGPEPTADLDVYRAAALRLAGRSLTRTDTDEAGLDLEISKRIIEHCWSVADAS